MKKAYIAYISFGWFCSEADFGGSAPCLCHWSISASQAATTFGDRTWQGRGTLLQGSAPCRSVPRPWHFKYSGLPKMVLKQICIVGHLAGPSDRLQCKMTQCCRTQPWPGPTMKNARPQLWPGVLHRCVKRLKSPTVVTLLFHLCHQVQWPTSKPSLWVSNVLLVSKEHTSF